MINRLTDQYAVSVQERCEHFESGECNSEQIDAGRRQ